ncbi:dehydrogenase [Capsulimonas corticalis]|uniref:Dehydrogenase n=1 Tax=Capsulimonas corticalis TaxID=2219043 RepID=A0A402D4R0_9BACT|nr:SDR family oxidoreductase [Capsulimonas corticalis]BDI31985.1 dehydrogenase [Capsulimonas corticalis]
MAGWTVSEIPSQVGRSAIVTGTGGLGLEAALALAGAGAEVIVAGRSADKGAAAVRKIRASVPGASVRFESLDLASLDSIQAFGARISAERERLDMLINNAGVMAPPRRQVTSDGFELQFGTNYLGHFALTERLLPLLRRAQNPRVISLSSVADRTGQINFDDLQSERGYDAMRAYCQSKLACLLFALELQRRSDAEGWRLASMAAHPGFARTDLIDNGAGARSPLAVFRLLLGAFVFQSAAQGALPILYAATAPGARPGGYYGPDGFQGFRGAPADAKIPAQGQDTKTAARLWEVSERLTGAPFPSSRPDGR